MADRDAEIAAGLDQLTEQIVNRKGTRRARRSVSDKPERSP
jgi:hypothetical protein